MIQNKSKLSFLGRKLMGLTILVGLCAPHASFAEGFEYAYTVGKNSGAFGTKSDTNIGGSLSVPIFAADPVLNQELMGEIWLGYAKTKDTGTFTAPNVTGLALPSEPGAATELEVTTFQVGAGLKYKIITLPELAGFLQIQPYVSAGAAFHVFLASTNGANGDRVGGIAPISPELAARGFPTGEGNVLIGAMYGVGTDFILFNNLLVGVDARWNHIAHEGANYSTIVGKVGFRF